MRRGRRWSYSILVAVKSAVVEAGIRIADTQCERGSSRIWQIVVDEVEVVGTEIGVAERRSWRHRVAIWSTTGGTGVQSGCDSQSASVEVVVGTGSCSTSSIVPYHVDQILGVERRVTGLSEQSDWTRTSDVDLLSVITRKDQDSVGVGVVWETEDRRLNRGEL